MPLCEGVGGDIDAEANGYEMLQKNVEFLNGTKYNFLANFGTIFGWFDSRRRDLQLQQDFRWPFFSGTFPPDLN